MAIDFEERARREAWSTEFHRGMKEYDSSRGIERAAAAPLRGRGPIFARHFGIEAQARAEWQKNPAIRAEFVELERYVAFAKADARSLIKILGRNRNA